MCERKTAEQKELLWFIEARDAFTNEVIQKALDEQTQRANQVTHISGVKRPVWEVPDYEFIRELRKSKNRSPYDFPLDLKPYNKIGDIVKPFKLQDGDVRKKSRKRMVNSKKAHTSRPAAK